MIEFEERNGNRVTIMEEKIVAFSEKKTPSGLSETKVYLQSSESVLLDINYNTFTNRLFS